MTAADTDAPRLVQYWHSDDVPDYVGKLMSGFGKHNPNLRHVVFDEPTACDFIADRFGRRHADAFAACAVPAMQADYFRYCAVHALGGVYVDANFASLRPLSGLLEAEGHLIAHLPRGPVLNGLFAFRAPRHPFLAMSIEVATRNVENRVSETVALTTGPAIFTGLRELARSGSLEPLRATASSRLRPRLDECWDRLNESFAAAVAAHGPVEEALAGIEFSSRDEMLELVRKPDLRGLRDKGSGRHWGHWEGSIFREATSRGAA